MTVLRIAQALAAGDLSDGEELAVLIAGAIRTGHLSISADGCSIEMASPDGVVTH